MKEVREFAAGVVIAGFDGTTIAESTFCHPEERSKSASRRTLLAGYVLFTRNIETLEQTRALNDALRELYPTDLSPILAIDQEGGRVVRLHDNVASIPAAAELGARNDPQECCETGAQVARDLVRAGFNLNFAPVLDLAVNPSNTVIGSRSFGSDPQRVATFAGAFARGMREHGIAVTYKHFPGHGSTSVDSHFDLPHIDLDETTFRARDLAPFTQLLTEGQCSVMAGHMVVHAFDAENPATLSPSVLTEILRGEIGFEGVCFTDCLQMDAIARTVGTAAAAPRAIAAGADCIVISRGIDDAFACVDAIEGAVEERTLSLSRLQEAYNRVKALRASLR